MKELRDVCAVCGQEVKGGFFVTSQDVDDGESAQYILEVTGTPDRDFNDCDSCNTRVHWRCSKHPRSGYCDACFEKYGLEDPADAGFCHVGK